MRVTHGWYETGKDKQYFKVLSNVVIELTTSEKWELSMILSTFIQDQKRQGHECGLELASSLKRQIVEDPNPNVPYYKEQIAELTKELKNERERNKKSDSS